MTSLCKILPCLYYVDRICITAIPAAQVDFVVACLEEKFISCRDIHLRRKDEFIRMTVMRLGQVDEIAATVAVPVNSDSRHECLSVRIVQYLHTYKHMGYI